MRFAAVAARRRAWLAKVKTLPDYMNWKCKTNTGFLQRHFRILSKHVRDTLMGWVREGSPEPRYSTEDMELTVNDYPDPEVAAIKLLRNAIEKSGMEALENQTKSLEKMVLLGALSTMLKNGVLTLINGKIIIVTPNFSVNAKKTRLVANFSYVPDRFRKDNNLPNFSINAGYENSQTTMSFKSIQDRASHALATYGFQATLVDMSGWFHQILNSRKLLHLNVKVVAVPLTDKPDGPIDVVCVPLHTNEMGDAGAAMVCGTLNNLFVEALDKHTASQNLFSVPRCEIKGPEAYGLASCKRSVKQFMSDEGNLSRLRSKKLRTQKKVMNNFKSAHTRHKTWADYRCGKGRFRLTMTHQDDTLVVHRASMLERAARCLYNAYKKAGWLTSTSLDVENFTSLFTFLGFQHNLAGGNGIPTFGLTPEKWRDYTIDILYLCYSKRKFDPTVGRLLSIAGRLSHVCEIFPWARAYLAPLTWLMSGCNTICKTSPGLWRTIKDATVPVPQIVLDLIWEIWEKVYKRTTSAIDFVLIEEDCVLKLSTDWAPTGIGCVNMTNGEYVGIPIPKCHVMYTEHRKQSTFGELMGAYLAIEFWTRGTSGMRISLRGDNIGALVALQRWRSIRVSGPLVLMFARLIESRRIIIIPRYVNTTAIVADPLTHVGDKSEKNKTWWRDFRFRMHSQSAFIGSRLPPQHFELDRRYKEYSEIASRYPFCNYRTKNPPSDISSGGTLMLREIAMEEIKSRVLARAHSASLNLRYIWDWVHFVQNTLGSREAVFGVFTKFHTGRDKVLNYIKCFISFLKTRYKGSKNLEIGIYPSTLRARVSMVLALLAIFREGEFRGLRNLWRDITQYEKTHVPREKKWLAFSEIENILRELSEEIREARKRGTYTISDCYNAAGTMVVFFMVLCHYRIGNLVWKTKSGSSNPLTEFDGSGIVLLGDKYKPSGAKINLFTKSDKLKRPNGQLAEAVLKGAKPHRPVEVKSSADPDILFGIVEIICFYLDCLGHGRNGFRGSIRTKNKKGEISNFCYQNFRNWLKKKFDGVVFESLGGNPILPENLRATGITHLLSLVPPEMASKIVGHASMETTNKYYVGWSHAEMAMVNAQHQACLLGVPGPSLEEFSPALRSTH